VDGARFAEVFSVDVGLDVACGAFTNGALVHDESEVETRVGGYEI